MSEKIASISLTRKELIWILKKMKYGSEYKATPPPFLPAKMTRLFNAHFYPTIPLHGVTIDGAVSEAPRGDGGVPSEPVPGHAARPDRAEAEGERREG